MGQMSRVGVVASFLCLMVLNCRTVTMTTTSVVTVIQSRSKFTTARLLMTSRSMNDATNSSWIVQDMVLNRMP